MKVVNPADGEVIDSVVASTPESIAAAHEIAAAATAEWRRVEVEDRVSVIGGLRAAVVARRDELAMTLTRETGKPITQAGNELDGLLARLDFFAARTGPAVAAEQVLVDHDEHLEEVISYDPLGVVANISAWNYPYFVGANVFVPAIATGNAVLYKPSELAPLTGRAIGELVEAAGAPSGIFQVLQGGSEVGEALLDQPVDGVFFTGSYRTGRAIADRVAGRFPRLQLELGGKDPVYVLDDAPIGPTAAGLADGAFYNNGQSCCSVERIYVHEAVHDDFVEAFLAEVAGFAVGDPTDPRTYIGPLTRAAQLEVLEQQVADATARGAVVATGGSRRPGPGNWFDPTVLVGTDHSMAVMRDETFGPLIAIQRVADDHEAATLMNDTDYGLTAGVYGLDRARAEAVLRRVDSGSAYWNCCDRVSPRLPWSGRGHSGIGTTLSVEGIRAFVRPRAWHLRG